MKNIASKKFVTKKIENNVEKFYLFGLLPFFKKSIKTPIIKDNTFLLWEPCSQSHSEVLPGYAKYLLDLGYHVSVLATTARFKEGLFARFGNENISYNNMNQKQIRKFFATNDLSSVKGAMVTTVGKLCDERNFDDAYNAFHPEVDKSKLFFVAHEAEHAADLGTWKSDLITLRELNYKGVTSVVVNPHYFGDIKITPKNEDITNFVMIGAIKPYKKNDNTIIEAIGELVKKGVTNFKVTVIGKGHIKNIPPEIRKFFDMKGRLPFKKMYDELEKADFLLTAYDEDNPKHVRYNTTGTSGNFQLVYGFLKPCVIIESFGAINGYTKKTSVLYKANNDYADALQRAVEISPEDYGKMQAELNKYVDKLYKTSLKNLKGAING